VWAGTIEPFLCNRWHRNARCGLHYFGAGPE